MSEALKILLGVVPDIAERIIDAILGKKSEALTASGLISELELDRLRQRAALRRAKQRVKRNART